MKMTMSDEQFVSRRGEYKGIPFVIVFENDFHYTVIAEGKEVCSGMSVLKVATKFQAMVDTGLELNN